MLIKSCLIAALSMGGAGGVVYLGTEPAETASLNTNDKHPHPPKSKDKKSDKTTAKDRQANASQGEPGKATQAGTPVVSKPSIVSNSVPPTVRSETGDAETLDAKRVKKKRSYIDRWRTKNAETANADTDTDERESEEAEVEVKDADAQWKRLDRKPVRVIMNNDESQDLDMDIDELVSLPDDVQLPDDLVSDLEDLFAKIELDGESGAESDPSIRVEKRMIVIKSDDMDAEDFDINALLDKADKNVRVVVKTKPGSKAGTATFRVDSPPTGPGASERLKIALKQAEKIMSNELRDQAYLDIVQYANTVGDFRFAQSTLSKINQIELRDTARARVAVFMAKRGQTGEAFEIIDTVEIEDLRDVMRLQVIEAMILPERLPAVGSGSGPHGLGQSGH